jgi:hypothetical protein
MIKEIHSGSAYLDVATYSASTYVNAYNGAQGVGNMRYNTINQKTEVFDGNNWVQLNTGSATIGLTTKAVSILNWAEKKMIEEYELEELAKEHPTIKDLVNQIKDKKDQIKMVQTLLKSPGHEPEQYVVTQAP